MKQKNTFPIIIIASTSGSPLNIRGDFRLEGEFGSVPVYTHDGFETKIRDINNDFVPDTRVAYHLQEPSYALVHPEVFAKLDKERLAVDLAAMKALKS